uniref:Myb/SANT-like DNA-binding domain-containing protein n=1 Tax=Glossina morsitans morsitans TaxID=37546 RepID=A0A1B0G0U3_GLOMM
MDSTEVSEMQEAAATYATLPDISKTSQEVTMASKDRQKEEEKVPKSMKQRYWHSWEELRLVELWRRYKDEVTDVHKCLPVYRKIVGGMKSFGFLVNTQDCRRKINTLTNRAEKRHMDISGNKSVWRLYPLINCIIDAKTKWEVDDPWHENRIIKNLLDKIDPPTESVSDNRSQPQQLPPRSPLQMRSINANEANVSPMETSTPPHQPTAQFQLSCDKRSRIIPINRLTEENLKQLRAENNRLAMERDEDLKRLRREEEGFHKFHAVIQYWNKQQEDVLQKICNHLNDARPTLQTGKT